MSVVKAIGESEAARASVRGETRNRNKWAYVSETELTKWAAKESITGSSETLVREFFKDHMVQMLVRVMSPADQKKVKEAGGVPPSYNPNAVVETGKNVREETFFAIWVAKGEPDFAPTF